MEALVTAAKNGDKEAFVQLIWINKQSMYKAAWVYLRNEQDIADALQNTILSRLPSPPTLSAGRDKWPVASPG